MHVVDVDNFYGDGKFLRDRMIQVSEPVKRSKTRAASKYMQEDKELDQCDPFGTIHQQ